MLYSNPVAHHTNCVSFSFTGSAGVAIISLSPPAAYLVTDSRYWLQARDQLDSNWVLVQAGAVNEVKDWTQWVIERAQDSKIGIDARLISYEKASALNTALKAKNSKLQYPPQNLVDLVWRDKPSRSHEEIYVQPQEFAGLGAGQKLAKVREWIQMQAPAVPSYSKSPPKASQMQVATLVSNLSCVGMSILRSPTKLLPHVLA